MQDLEDLIPTTAYYRRCSEELHAKLRDERNYPLDDLMPEEKFMQEWRVRTVQEFYLSYLASYPLEQLDAVTLLQKKVQAEFPMRVWLQFEVIESRRDRVVMARGRYKVRNRAVLLDEAAFKHNRWMSARLREVLSGMDLYIQDGSRAYDLRGGEIWVGTPVFEGGKYSHLSWSNTGHTLRAVQERLAVEVQREMART